MIMPAQHWVAGVIMAVAPRKLSALTMSVATSTPNGAISTLAAVFSDAETAARALQGKRATAEAVNLRVPIKSALTKV